MTRLTLFAGLLFVAGCGPLSKPLPERLTDNDQKAVDAAWDRAVTPAGKHDRQTWLDVFVTTYAHEAGVDRLTFRSEKDLAAGKVVMEVFFERAKPADDRFVVTVLDAAGNVVRSERYTREDVKRTWDEFHPPNGQQPPPAVEQRAERVKAILPRPEAK